MKKNILYKLTIIALMFSGSIIKAQQALSPNLFSTNGWMPDTVGGGTNVFDSTQCPGLKVGFNLPCYVNGQIYQRMESVQTSQARFIRYGGTTADQNKPTFPQYRRFVDSVRARGMEPVLQIPLNLKDASFAYDTLLAKQIIQEVNDAPYNRNVVYWSIGNEPDQPPPSGYGYNSKDSAIKITNYIKNWSKAMRRAVPSVPIKICGPELAEWNSDAYYTKKNLVDSLLTPGQRCDISGFDAATGKPWIDIFSFHWYDGINGDNASLPRATLIAKLRSTKGLAQTLDTLNVKLTAANSYHSRTGSAALISAITEANLGYQSISTDAFSDVKCNGFFAGQYWLEIASIAAEKGVNMVNFWSAAENSMGYMKNDGTKKSSYYHFKEAAENFSDSSYTGTDNQTNIKAFGTKDGNQIVVMVMNQDTITAASKPYTIRLDNTLPGTTTAIKMNMSVAAAYTDTVDASSTTLLVFDLYGKISGKYYYKQSEGSSQPGFHQRFSVCGSTGTFASQIALDAYYPAVYNNLVLGDASGTNSVTIDNASPHNNTSIYRAVNSITLEKNFSSGAVGQTLELIIDPICQ